VIEARSRDTREKAIESARIAAARDWRSILLVTSAAHVERAAGCLHRIGLRRRRRDAAPRDDEEVLGRSTGAPGTGYTLANGFANPIPVLSR
jgi:uncharacterized SAM-binding protein YcdF (DUF218 family)